MNKDKPIKLLSAWLHLSNECNFNCTYCYLNHSTDKMNLETGLQAIGAVFNSAYSNNLKEVVLKYAGGEAIFNFEVLQEMQKKALALAEELDIQLTSTLLTNGTTISDEVIPLLKNLQIGVAVGLDGLFDFQNIQRKYKDGSGTYEDVIYTLEKLNNAGILTNIAITITDNNVEGLPALVEFLLKKNFPFNLNFFRENNFAQKNALTITDDKIIYYLRQTYKVIEKYLPNRTYLSSLLDIVDLAGPHQYPCSIGINYVIIDPYGRLYKCQMDIGKNRIIGNIWQDDILKIIQNDTSQLQPISVNEKNECQDCEIKYYCAGGCPQLAMKKGDIKSKSPFCNIYKSLYKDVLRLEALRMVKYEKFVKMTLKNNSL